MLGDEVTQAILTDWRTATVNGRLRATLGFLEKLTLYPEEIAPEDVAALRSEGLSDAAIRDAIYVCVGFNMINRIADALGFKVPPPEVFTRGAKFLLIFGYRILSSLHPANFITRHDRQAGADKLKDDNTSLRRDDPYADSLECLKASVLCGPGFTDPALRRAASVAGEIPGALGAYVQKVVLRAHAVTDEDVALLRRGGCSDDQIFEVTVSAALGAGLVRLESGLTALCSEYSPATRLASQEEMQLDRPFSAPLVNSE